MASERKTPSGSSHRAAFRGALLLLGALGCGPRAAQAPPPAQSPPGPAAAGDPGAGDPRSLPADASYGDLVERIGLLDGRAQEAGREACILARYTQTGHFELPVELAVAVRPPPAPPVDLDEALEAGPSLRLLSRFGEVGEGELVLVELTTTRPTREMAALVLTDAGGYLAVPGAEPVWTGPQTLDALAPALAQLGARTEPVRLEVLAEAGLPLAQVDAALFAIKDLGLPVSLATILPEGTRLPDHLRKRAGPTCPQGLAPSDVAAGELDVEAAQARLSPFAEAARICAHQVGGRALAGGKLVLAMRVGDDGRVSEVCSVRDDIGDARLLECLQHAAARLRFPEPGGVVDLQLPLRLSPFAVQVPRAVCE